MPARLAGVSSMYVNAASDSLKWNFPLEKKVCVFYPPSPCPVDLPYKIISQGKHRLSFAFKIGLPSPLINKQIYRHLPHVLFCQTDYHLLLPPKNPSLDIILGWFPFYFFFLAPMLVHFGGLQGKNFRKGKNHFLNGVEVLIELCSLKQSLNLSILWRVGTCEYIKWSIESLKENRDRGLRNVSTVLKVSKNLNKQKSLN